MKNNILLLSILLAASLSLYASCSKSGNNPNPVDPPVNIPNATAWVTNGDGSVLLTQQAATLPFGKINNTNYNIEVDSSIIILK